MPETEVFLKKLRHQSEQIDELVSSFRPLLDTVNIREPDLVELSALATVLHSFYGGVENIFTTIGKYVDNRLPSSPQWHKDLLQQMSRLSKNRTVIVSEELYPVLIGYLSFRHFFRNSYAYQLDWDQMGPLVGSMVETWEEIKKSLTQFFITEESGGPI